ncbi:MAG: hypothetical protein GY788_08000 [bacterium]|nr:hypothetical protein [bacterium]
MLLDIVLDPACVCGDEDLPHARASCQALLRAIERFGVWVRSDADRHEVVERIMCLGDGPRRRWLNVFSGLPERVLATGMNGVEAGADLESLCSQVGGDLLILLSDSRSTLVSDLSAESSVLLSSGCEVGRSDAVQLTTAIEERDELSQAPILRTTERDEVWADRLKPLFETSTRVTVVDRYAVRHASKMLAHSGAANGVGWFFERIGEDADGPAIDLLCSELEPEIGADPNQSARETAALIWDLCSEGVTELNVYWIDDGLFGQIAHDRYLRFTGGSGRSSRIVELGQSLDLFASTHARQDCSFSYRTLLTSGEPVQPYRHREEQIMDIARREADPRTIQFSS